RRQHTRLGMPVYDVEQLILQQNKENANIPHGPEATNLTLAETIKKEFAFLNVFEQEVGDAHMRGDIHLHDLGFIDRPYCSGQSLEYIKKFGLSLPNALSLAKPARHAEVLLAHMVKFAAALQSNFAGAIGWDAVNLFFAPYLGELDDRQVKQLAQMLIFEFSQQAVARGGQAIFSDINLYWEVPDHFAEVRALGPGGVYVKNPDPVTREAKPYLTYADFEKEAQRFVWALFEVYLEGDGSGRPFFFPKPLVHITEKFFRTPGHREFLHLICQVASEKGNTYFVFDRGGTAKISECCRLSFKLEESDLEDAKTPWRMRYSALQNVTLNLPRLAYLAEGDDTRLMDLIQQRIELAVRAHLQKRAFIERLLQHGEKGPLALLGMDRDGERYLRMHRASYLIGMVGLNEMVQHHKGVELHQTDEAIQFGLKVIAYMKILCDKHARKHGMHFVLEQTPAESTAYRFAKLDRENFPEQTEKVVKGRLETHEIYYTNSTLFNVGADLNPIERVKLEGRFHPLIEAGSISHIWLGEARPSAESLANFVIKTFRWTKNDQIAFSPEFSNCRTCGRTFRGLIEACPECGSDDLEGITRITGYFTKLSSWNKGKLGELRDRYRNQPYFGGPTNKVYKVPARWAAGQN
ncbi:MAG: anaerobic ribonucleoside-triphosphate reductase, partial [Thermodesulfobacteriota bacterium]